MASSLKCMDNFYKSIFCCCFFVGWSVSHFIIFWDQSILQCRLSTKCLPNSPQPCIFCGRISALLLTIDFYQFCFRSRSCFAISSRFSESIVVRLRCFSKTVLCLKVYSALLYVTRKWKGIACLFFRGFFLEWHNIRCTAFIQNISQWLGWDTPWTRN